MDGVPNPALGGLTPAEKVETPEGMAEVVAILEPMASARVSAIPTMTLATNS